MWYRETRIEMDGFTGVLVQWGHINSHDGLAYVQLGH